MVQQTLSTVRTNVDGREEKKSEREAARKRRNDQNQYLHSSNSYGATYREDYFHCAWEPFSLRYIKSKKFQSQRTLENFPPEAEIPSRPKTKHFTISYGSLRSPKLHHSTHQSRKFVSTDQKPMVRRILFDGPKTKKETAEPDEKKKRRIKSKKI